MTAPADPLGSLRREVAAEHGLSPDAGSFLQGETLEQLEASAVALTRVTTDGRRPELEPDIRSGRSIFAEAAAQKERRKQELAELLCGRPRQPRDEHGRFSFDGGARKSLAVPTSPERAHGELVAGLAAITRTFGRRAFPAD